MSFARLSQNSQRDQRWEDLGSNIRGIYGSPFIDPQINFSVFGGGRTVREHKLKKLLTSSAIAIVATAGAASAQSVLERVLGEIDNASNLASVNGTFANIAENLGGAGNVTVYADPASTSDVITQAEFDAAAALDYQADFAAVDGTDYVDPSAGVVITAEEYAALSDADQAAYQLVSSTPGYWTNGASVIADASYDNLEASNAYSAYEPTVVEVAGLFGVDGSITTSVNGVTSAVAEATEKAVAGAATAYEFNLPTVDIGDLSTTALGAVNTGDITLGVNSTVDDAKTSSTQAVSSVMDQLGGSADTGAIVLNIASNMTGVNGSINTVMTDVNGKLNSASTTALGAVNTGTIVSGVNAAVQGIVGTSGAVN